MDKWQEFIDHIESLEKRIAALEEQLSDNGSVTPEPARCPGCGALWPSCVCPAADERAAVSATKARRDALDELVRLSEDLGLYELPGNPLIKQMRCVKCRTDLPDAPYQARTDCPKCGHRHENNFPIIRTEKHDDT